MYIRAVQIDASCSEMVGVQAGTCVVVDAVFEINITYDIKTFVLFDARS